jgi:hypothetical protein
LNTQLQTLQKNGTLSQPSVLTASWQSRICSPFERFEKDAAYIIHGITTCYLQASKIPNRIALNLYNSLLNILYVTEKCDTKLSLQPVIDDIYHVLKIENTYSIISTCWKLSWTSRLWTIAGYPNLLSGLMDVYDVQQLKYSMPIQSVAQSP